MARWDLRSRLLVAASLAVLLGLLGGLALDAGRPIRGFFATPDYYVVPIEPAARAAGLRPGDRLVAVDGDSPLTLAARVRAAAGPIRYEVERAGRRLSVELAPRPLTWSRLVDHFGVYFLVSAIMLIVGRGGLRAEPGGGAQPPLPPLYVPLGRLQRGGARGGAGRAPLRGGPRRPASPRCSPSTAGSSSSRTRPMPTASAGSSATA